MVSVSGARQFVTALRSEVQPTLGRQWPRHLTTDGQPCPEQLTQKPLAGLFGTHTTRPNRRHRCLPAPRSTTVLAAQADSRKIRAVTVRADFPVFLRAPGRWRTACRLGPPVLWRRRTFDRRIERCAPAVPQHDRARTSAIPLPAHRPCAAASQQSPVAIVPHGDVGCLVGFRQEGSAPSTPYMRYLIKWGNSFASFAQKVHNRANLDGAPGCKLKCPSSSHRSSFQSASSRMSA